VRAALGRLPAAGGVARPLGVAGGAGGLGVGRGALVAAANGAGDVAAGLVVAAGLADRPAPFSGTGAGGGALDTGGAGVAAGGVAGAAAGAAAAGAGAAAAGADAGPPTFVCGRLNSANASPIITSAPMPP